MMFVLGLLVLLAISAALLFASVRRSNEIVERGYEELQDVMAGRSALSFAVSRIQAEPSLAEGWGAEWRDKDDSTGFRLSMSMRGVFPRVVATHLRSSPPKLIADADLARIWITHSPPALVLWGGGDVVMIGNASIDGAVYSSNSGRPAPGAPGSIRRHGLDELPDWLERGLDTVFVAGWQRAAESTLAGRSTSLMEAGEVQRVSPTHRGVARLGKGVWIWSGPAVIDSIVCDRCILLAKALKIRKSIRLHDGLVWSRGSLSLSGRVDGIGQILSSDTLFMDSLVVTGGGTVFGAIGRELMEYDSVPTGRSSAFLRMRRVRGAGTGVVFSRGRRLMDRSPVLDCDSLSGWKGSLLVNGVVRWKGNLDSGALFADRLIGVRADKVLQDGGLEGKLGGLGKQTRLLFPWVGSEPGLVGIAYWSFHAPQ